MKIAKLLTTRGLHYVVTRFGPRNFRAAAFDEKYRSGDWRTHNEADGQLPPVVRNYLKGGRLLIMGCGGASVLSGFAASDFSGALGIDISSEAISLASRYSSERVAFQLSDMRNFTTDERFEVILFSESLYYVPAPARREFLKRISKLLTPGGVIIATLAQPRRYRSILCLIRESFTVLEDRVLEPSSRSMLVFR